MQNTSSSKSLISYGFLVALGAATMASVSQGDAHQEPLGTHRVSLPAMRPDAVSAECTGEATAYAAAIVHLENATTVAQEQWQEWYDCEQEASQGGKVVNPDLVRAATTSVLEDE